MRRKPSGQGNYNNNNGGGNNQQRKHRYQNNNGGGGNHQNRPRKNYSAMREKYLQQARDALGQGDRVLAENYFQHADHCYRMMVEEGYNTRNTQQHAQQSNDAPTEQTENTGDNNAQPEPPMQEEMDRITQLPAFLTGAVMPQDPNQPPVEPQNWEE